MTQNGVDGFLLLGADGARELSLEQLAKGAPRERGGYRQGPSLSRKDGMDMLRRAKVWTNQLCDRILEWCVRVLLDETPLRWPLLRRVARRLARGVASACTLWH